MPDCPLIQDDCVKDSCLWYDHYGKCCVMQTLAVSLHTRITQKN